MSDALRTVAYRGWLRRVLHEDAARKELPMTTPEPVRYVETVDGRKLFLGPEQFIVDADELHALREEAVGAYLLAAVAGDREALGRAVRDVWLGWAREQPRPKPTWLLEWDQLPEADKEVDRRIGERLFALGRAAAARGGGGEDDGRDPRT